MSIATGMVIRDPWYDFGTNPAFPSQINQAFQDRVGLTLADLGVRWVRFEFRIEHGDVADQVARNDYFINVVAPRHSIQILGLLGFGLIADRDPHTLHAAPFRDDPVYGGGVSAAMRVWLDRACVIISRYGERVAAYEILNEHNRVPLAGDPILAPIAARLHTKFYRFFRQVDRQQVGQEWRDAVKIISGGLHPAGSGQRGRLGYLTDIDYLKALYTSDPFAGYRQANGHFPFDGLAYHPYPEEIRRSLGQPASLVDSADADTALILKRLDEVRAALAGVGHDDVPFWITEIGCNMGYGRKTEAGQAQFLRTLMPRLKARGDVAQTFWFKYEDFPPADGPNAQKWGVVCIPFALGNDPGGCCYAVDGLPSQVRSSYLAFRELAQV